jgi:PST family polysaccharide transporter
MTISFLNGQKEIRKWAYVNLVQVAMTLFIVSWGSLIFGTKGALVGFSVAHMVAFGINYLIIKKSGLVLFMHNLRNVDLNILRRSIGFSTFTFVSLICVPLSIFFVRDAVLVQNGAVYAGYWQGVFFLCTAFQTLITTAFSVYYLPTISAENDKLITKREVLTTLYLAFFVSLFGHLALYLFRDLAIKIVFNSDFLPMADLFLWQLVGSHFKICAWVYSYLLFSRDQISWLISLEVVFSCSFIALAHFLLSNYGPNGANLAFAVNNFLYLVVVIVLTRKLRILREGH